MIIRSQLEELESLIDKKSGFIPESFMSYHNYLKSNGLLKEQDLMLTTTHIIGLLPDINYSMLTSMINSLTDGSHFGDFEAIAINEPNSYMMFQNEKSSKESLIFTFFLEIFYQDNKGGVIFYNGFVSFDKEKTNENQLAITEESIDNFFLDGRKKIILNDRDLIDKVTSQVRDYLFHAIYTSRQLLI